MCLLKCQSLKKQTKCRCRQFWKKKTSAKICRKFPVSLFYLLRTFCWSEHWEQYKWKTWEIGRGKYVHRAILYGSGVLFTSKLLDVNEPEQIVAGTSSEPTFTTQEKCNFHAADKVLQGLNIYFGFYFRSAFFSKFYDCNCFNLLKFTIWFMHVFLRCFLKYILFSSV